jgi:hypothetical protein
VKITAGIYASFEDMCWTIPSERMGEIAHKAIYGTPTKQELRALAGMFTCYHHILTMPARLREKRVKQLREALKLASASTVNPEHPT